MGAGGVIIIKKQVAIVGGLDSVKNSIPEHTCARLEHVLAEGAESWDADEFQFVMRCISMAYDSFGDE